MKSRNLPAALPVDEALPEIHEALSRSRTAVLVAPPGAGKTTRVPIALREGQQHGSGKIIILEPRRIAARAAAQRMASLLGETIGATVGLRARLDTRVGPDTHIEVVTEGVFTRMILADPLLEGIGTVIFDEFHERSLDADLGLALALDARTSLREDLRIMVMSATLSGARIAELIGNAPVVESEGRMFPVETRYLGRDPNVRIEDSMTEAIMRALRHDEGSILAFLPGQGEIRRTLDRLRERIDQPDVILAPLYGAMDARAQDLAIAPPPEGCRKIVLATAIAETSLTIEGVRIVVDSGLSRQPRFEPGAGVTRLETVRAAKASINQRRGRAGRTSPGICYRLWGEAQTRSLPEYADPEILSSDLSGLLLDCADWGVPDPMKLRWLDPPPAASLETARASLIHIGALDKSGHITPLGRRLRRLPLPPPLASMIVSAAETGKQAAIEAAQISALLVERGLGGTSTDLTDRLERFRSEHSGRARQVQQLARSWVQSAMKTIEVEAPSKAHLEDTNRLIGQPQQSAPGSIATHLMHAFPDRIAKARGEPGKFLLANGRGATLDPSDPLARAPYLVIAELQGAAAATRILSAAPATEEEVLYHASARIEETHEIIFDDTARAVRARATSRLGALVLSSTAESLDGKDRAKIQAALAAGIAKLGGGALPWSKAQRQLRHRVEFLRMAGDASLPDLSDRALGHTTAEWLLPFLDGKSRISEITASDLDSCLQSLIPWNLKQLVDEDAPTHYLAPTGERHPIDYEGSGAPALHIRVQELFGLKAHPAIAAGRLPLTLNLLSPAHRPIQITRDLPGFWSGSWAAVKSEMKGRYPKHVWPDDPANAAPTRRAKPRGT